MGLFDEELTYSVIGAFLKAYNKLGPGFIESVYVKALTIELGTKGHHVSHEVPIAVHYDDGSIIGSFKVDLLVERRLILEVKSEFAPKGTHERQLRNYLSCSTFELGLLLVFGDKPAHKRVIHTRDKKRWLDQWPLPPFQ